MKNTEKISLEKLLQLQKIIAYLKENIASRHDLGEELKLSESSVEKLIKMLKDVLGYEIKNIGREKKYELKKDNQKVKELLFENLNIIKDILKIHLAQNTESFIDYLKSMNKNPFIRLENNTIQANFEFMDTILKAITDKKIISFDYKKISDEKAISRVIMPYLIHEYKNNWFVLGLELARDNQKVQDDEFKWIKYYNLRHISNCRLGSEKRVFFEDKTNYRQKIQEPNYFEKAYGLYINVDEFENESPQEIILSFDVSLKKELEEKPLHISQKIIDKNNGKNFKIKMDIYFLETDFLKELATYGKNVKVIAPLSLRERLKSYLYEAWKQYE